MLKTYAFKVGGNSIPAPQSHYDIPGMGIQVLFIKRSDNRYISDILAINDIAGRSGVLSAEFA